MAASYSTEEEEQILAALEGGAGVCCPRCGSELASREVPPRADVAYVRNRIWLRCDACGLQAVLDRRAQDP